MKSLLILRHALSFFSGYSIKKTKTFHYGAIIGKKGAKEVWPVVIVNPPHKQKKEYTN